MKKNNVNHRRDIISKLKYTVVPKKSNSNRMLSKHSEGSINCVNESLAREQINYIVEKIEKEKREEYMK